MDGAGRGTAARCSSTLSAFARSAKARFIIIFYILSPFCDLCVLRYYSDIFIAMDAFVARIIR